MLRLNREMRNAGVVVTLKMTYMYIERTPFSDKKPILGQLSRFLLLHIYYIYRCSVMCSGCATCGFLYTPRLVSTDWLRPAWTIDRSRSLAGA